jgi:uncharacterized membrane protein YgcG
MKNSIFLIPMAMFAVSLSEPVFAQTSANAPAPIVRNSMTMQAQFNEFRAAMSGIGIAADYQIVDDVKPNMETYTKARLNEMTNQGANSMMIVIATDRVNKIQTRPAIRIEGKGIYLSTSEIDLIMDQLYYPTLKENGFDSAFPFLLTAIKEQALLNKANSQPATTSNPETTGEDLAQTNTEQDGGFWNFLPFLLGFGGVVGGGILLYKYLFANSSKKVLGYKSSFKTTSHYSKSKGYIETDSGVDIDPDDANVVGTRLAGFFSSNSSDSDNNSSSGSHNTSNWSDNNTPSYSNNDTPSYSNDGGGSNYSDSGSSGSDTGGSFSSGDY